MSHLRLLFFCAIGAFMWAALLVPPLALSAPGIDEADRVRVHLERLVGDLPDRPSYVGDDQAMNACAGSPAAAEYGITGCWGIAHEDHILLSGDAVDALYARDTTALILVAHEHLHRPDDDRLLDEGIVSSLAADLCPALAFSLWGMRGPCEADYGYYESVAGVRLASSWATGRGVRSWAARSWRRSLWAMTPGEREVAYEAALS